MEAAALRPLLARCDPDPVEVVNADSAAPVVFLCEHAGRAIPEALGDMGLSEADRASHIGWDIGAEALARRIAQALGAPLILQRYSRLVIDANRPPGSATSIPEVSDGIAIPANRGKGQSDARRIEIFEPMDRAIDRALTTPRRAVFSIHSFTPQFQGQDRPWHAGFLTRTSLATAERLRASIARAAPDLRLAINEPYQIEDQTDWFIPVHAEPRALPHALIEVRNDQLDGADGTAFWADLLTRAIQDVLRELP